MSTLEERLEIAARCAGGDVALAEALACHPRMTDVLAWADHGPTDLHLHELVASELGDVDADMVVQAYQDALDLLGETVQEMAARLETRGIRGIPCDPCECLLARWLRSRLPWIHHTSVSPDHGARGAVEHDGVAVLELQDGESLAMPLSWQWNDLAAGFDDMDFPDLVERKHTDAEERE